ncbi:hypothetical protein JX265_001296 [Neoarthrinium moseri]|uniref:Crh-like protein n=1 Tax=Neoarthrinium moseri TaxID=1658444 RepID=A0A9P9WXI1_9PEZI|nr:uncharacterized protein JN550_010746 [Neoarthrinium moseri]KAI1848965.1 hypothetical protein JX266_005393 [Neoarthrinium moseri]KAI1861676.1 hypothetical protein JN550_010746 [Neoarthrinium moseri]KAI1881056.1 hypothetical protein JX265_001296 [Neoarthrinium moseri]
MYSKILSSAAVALAASQLVSAQTFTKCNPMEKKCPDDPALGTSISIDFTKGNNDFFEELDGTDLTYDNSLGAVYTIEKESNAPTVQSTKYIFFGKVDVTLRASVGQGVVTSFVLQSDDLDEIDWEWLGGDVTQVQTNYFGKGDTTTYDRGAYHNVNNPQDEFHTYTIDWTQEYVKWYIDGSLVRTLNYADAKEGTRFPQTPMQIKLGTWVAGGKDSPKGTVEWAGGYTDFSKGPFHAYYKSITIEDYANGVQGAKSYSWNEGSDGSYGSIKVITDEKEVTTSTSSSSDSKATVVSTLSDGSKTTLTTASITSAKGLTQATNGADVNTTITSQTASETIATTLQTGSRTTSTSSSSTSAPAGSGAFKQGFNFALLGASAFLGFLLL